LLALLHRLAQDAVPDWHGDGRAARRRVGSLYTGRLSGGGEMAYTYHELKGKTIQELREIAKSVENHDAVQGYSQLNKDHLLPALCKALGIESHEHHDVVGIDKPAI